jgi:hypothetical protein
MISAVAVDPYSRRQLFANAAIAASRVGSYPCATRRISPLCPLAHIRSKEKSPGTAGAQVCRLSIQPQRLER